MLLSKHVDRHLHTTSHLISSTYLTKARALPRCVGQAQVKRRVLSKRSHRQCARTAVTYWTRSCHMYMHTHSKCFYHNITTDICTCNMSTDICTPYHISSTYVTKARALASCVWQALVDRLVFTRGKSALVVRAMQAQL